MIFSCVRARLNFFDPRALWASLRAQTAKTLLCTFFRLWARRAQSCPCSRQTGSQPTGKLPKSCLKRAQLVTRKRLGVCTPKKKGLGAARAARTHPHICRKRAECGKRRPQPYWGRENSGNALEASNALNYRVWAIPAVLSKSVSGVLPEFFQNSFRTVPAVLGVWPKYGFGEHGFKHRAQ